jgi:hypothetical protein
MGMGQANPVKMTKAASTGLGRPFFGVGARGQIN